MARRLDEIAAKYGLSLHTESADNISEDELCALVGGDFLGGNRAYTAYMYEDGTFAFDGETNLDGYGLLDYQFMRSVRGTFTGSMLTLGSVDEYTEWQYTTDCGISVTLALASHKALIIADLADSFVTVNVLAGTATPEDDIFSSGPITAEILERFADGFDLSLLTLARPLDTSLLSPKPVYDEDDSFYYISGMYESEAQRFYSELVGHIESGDRQAVADMLLYPALLTVPSAKLVIESPDELLEYYNDIVTPGLLEQIQTTCHDDGSADLISADGMVGAANGAIWFLKSNDGKVSVITIQNSEGWSVRGNFIRPEQTTLTVMVEGMAEYLSATLYKGAAYSVYIPDGGWKLSAEDSWTHIDSENVSFGISIYNESTAVDLEARYNAEGYSVSDDGYWMTKYDNASGMYYGIRLFEGKSMTAAFSFSYPFEAAEGLGMHIYAVAGSFVFESSYDNAVEAYAAVLERLFNEHILPDGTRCEPNIPMDLNRFAVCDVNGDGANELVLLFTDTYTAGQAGYVIAYSEETGGIRVELSEYPLLSFYDNGCVKAGWLHNQGAAGDSLWPYTLYRYDRSVRRYIPEAMVDAWDRSMTEIYQGESFPEEADRSGSGVVYYIMPPDSYDNSEPKDILDYEAWLSEQLGAANEIDITYLNLTAENINRLRSGL